MAISVASCIISIHAPREGSDGRLSSTTGGKDGISIHAPREGSDVFQSGFHTVLPISIHAPREGSDGDLVDDYIRRLDISIHAPREGSDAPPGRLVLVGTIFLSTLPARGATSCLAPGFKRVRNFYPRSPRGERPYTVAFIGPCLIFLSTLPARGATSNILTCWVNDTFLSTLPARGATTTPITPM